MAILLRRFDKAREVGDLDIETGRIATREAPASLRPCGYFSRYSGKFVAIYASGGRLWLQVDRFRVDIYDPEITLDWRRLSRFRNEFIVSRINRPVLSLRYPSALTNLLNLLDPTFDALDEEAEDLPLWLTRIRPNQEWHRNALRDWDQPATSSS